MDHYLPHNGQIKDAFPAASVASGYKRSVDRQRDEPPVHERSTFMISRLVSVLTIKKLTCYRAAAFMFLLTISLPVVSL